MTLRARLLVGVLATALPVAVVATVMQTRRESERAAELVRARALALLEAVGREACEEQGYDFPPAPNVPSVDDWLFDLEPPRPMPMRRAGHEGLRYFVYDAQLRGVRHDAPRIPEPVARSVARGSDGAAWTARGAARGGHGTRVERRVVRAPWESEACAYLVVERPVVRSGGLGARMVAPLSVTLAVVVAVLVVAGPMVERIRRLTRSVHAGRTVVDETGRDEIAELARAFGERERTIAGQLAELAAREGALREHLAATSHDVLLPITVLAGHLVTIDEATREGRAAPSEAVRGALEETDYVTSLVRDLNAEARLRSGSPEVRIQLDLGQLVERVASRHRMLAERAGIALEFAVPETSVRVLGDPTLVEQMLSNLVNNAVRYGRQGGHVAVVLSVDASRFVVEVLDDGPGVPEALLVRLGERGFRTDEARTRRPEGMGLGLHIAREVAAVHGFTLTFARNEPTGLHIRLDGPVSSAAPDGTPPSPASGALLGSPPP